LRNDQDYEVQKDLDRVKIGLAAMEHAKFFCSQYRKTLAFIEQANLSPEKKAVAYVLLLENEMDARAKASLIMWHSKLQDLVRASPALLANKVLELWGRTFQSRDLGN
jgi:hypothetical protein